MAIPDTACILSFFQPHNSHFVSYSCIRLSLLCIAGVLHTDMEKHCCPAMHSWCSSRNLCAYNHPVEHQQQCQAEPPRVHEARQCHQQWPAQVHLPHFALIQPHRANGNIQHIKWCPWDHCLVQPWRVIQILMHGIAEHNHNQHSPGTAVQPIPFQWPGHSQ